MITLTENNHTLEKEMLWCLLSMKRAAFNIQDIWFVAKHLYNGDEGSSAFYAMKRDIICLKDAGYLNRCGTGSGTRYVVTDKLKNLMSI